MPKHTASAPQKHRAKWPYFTLVLGILILAYPVVLDWRMSQAANNKIQTMVATTDETTDPRRLEQLTQAQAYNAQLAREKLGATAGVGVDNAGMAGGNGTEVDILDMTETQPSSNDLHAYDEQLTWKGAPALAWIEIPAANLRMPIYHGTSDEALAAGVGHMEWSSLPVGGRSTHCVLTGHSGLRSSRMFDDVRKLRIGDTFFIHTLADSYCYQVFDIQTVLPDEATGLLQIQPQEDLVTLMTCTPYGLNTHRLLVHARRVPFEPSNADAQVPITAYANLRTVPLTLVLLLTVVVVVSALVRRMHRKSSGAGSLSHAGDAAGEKKPRHAGRGV